MFDETGCLRAIGSLNQYIQVKLSYTVPQNVGQYAELDEPLYDAHFLVRDMHNLHSIVFNEPLPGVHNRVAE